MERHDTKNKKIFLLAISWYKSVNSTLNCAPKLMIIKPVLCIAVHRLVGYYDTQATNLK